TYGLTSSAGLRANPAASYHSTAAGVSESTSRVTQNAIERQTTLGFSLWGSNPRVQAQFSGDLRGTTNYLIGNESSKWVTGVPTFSRVKFSDVYPGIDVVYYAQPRELEYDFVIAPHSNPDSIRLEAESGSYFILDQDGGLLIRTNCGEISQGRPAAYQMIHSARRFVLARYTLAGRHEARVTVGDYDPNLPLVIDPTLIYSTYLGGAGLDEGLAIAVDTFGSVYVAGDTTSLDFPLSSLLQQANGGASDVFVAKMNAEGTSLDYATYIGGSGVDIANGIAVDSTGSVYITGSTDSQNFPVVNPIQSSLKGMQDLFIAKLDPMGASLEYSTYLGGSKVQQGNAIAVGPDGSAYVAGKTSSKDFPA
ncbi:MAG: SBBP repeat-containing protein, partial [Blastocatellia bacterium]